MRKLLLLVGLLLSFGLSLSTNADSSNDFMRARRLIARGDELERAGNIEGAREQYSAAMEKLRAIQQAAPDWEPGPVEDQIKYCLDHIWKGQGQIQSVTSSGESTKKSSSKAAPSAAKTAKNAPSTKSKATSSAKETARSQTKGSVKQQAKAQGTDQLTRSESTKSKTGTSGPELVKKTKKEDSKSSSERGSSSKMAQENRPLKGRLESTREKPKDLQRAYSDEGALLREKLAKMEAQLEDLRKQKSPEGRNELKESLKVATEEFRKANEAQNKRFHMLLQENNSLKEDLKAAKARQKVGHSGSEEQLAVVLSENDLLKKRIQKLEEERVQDPSKEDLSRSRARIENLLKENDSLKAANSALKPAVESNEKRIQELMRENAELKSTRSDWMKAQVQMEVLQKENDSLKQASSTRTSTLEAKEEYFATILQENKYLKAKMTKLEKGLQAFHSHQQEIKPVKAELAKVRAMLEISKREGEEMKASLEQLKGQPVETVRRRPASESLQISSSKPEPDQDLTGASTPASASSPSPSSQGVGEIVLLNTQDRFVVVNYGAHQVPSANTELGVYREGNRVGSLKVTPPVRPPFVAADLVSGTARRGDAVR